MAVFAFRRDTPVVEKVLSLCFCSGKPPKGTLLELHLDSYWALGFFCFFVHVLILLSVRFSFTVILCIRQFCKKPSGVNVRMRNPTHTHNPDSVKAGVAAGYRDIKRRKISWAFAPVSQFPKKYTRLYTKVHRQVKEMPFILTRPPLRNSFRCKLRLLMSFKSGIIILWNGTEWENCSTLMHLLKNNNDLEWQNDNTSWGRELLQTMFFSLKWTKRVFNSQQYIPRIFNVDWIMADSSNLLCATFNKVA